MRPSTPSVQLLGLSGPCYLAPGVAAAFSRTRPRTATATTATSVAAPKGGGSGARMAARGLRRRRGAAAVAAAVLGVLLGTATTTGATAAAAATGSSHRIRLARREVALAPHADRLLASAASGGGGNVSRHDALRAAYAELPPAVRMLYAREAAARAGVNLAYGSDGEGGGGRVLQELVPLYGEFLNIAYYYAAVFLGNPPQEATVITDTGSTLTAIPCVDCGDKCGRHINPAFDPAASSTGSMEPCATANCAGCTANNEYCQYHQGYVEGSVIEGTLHRDTAFLGVSGDPTGGAAHTQYAVSQFTFGCHSNEGGLFRTQAANGIMGIGPAGRSFTLALWNAGRLDRNMFSLCMTRSGGAMTMGAIDHDLHTTPLGWADLSLSAFYSVTIESLSLAGVYVPATATIAIA